MLNQGDNSAPGLPQMDQEGRPHIFQGTLDLGVFECGVVDTTMKDAHSMGNCGERTPML